jgi:signal transduction histidine kinase
MSKGPEIGGNFLRRLIGGFALLVLLLGATAYVEIGVVRSTGSEAMQLVEEERAAMRLIDEVQREEDSLSSVFYSLADGRGTADRTQLLERLDSLQAAIHRATDAGTQSTGADIWNQVRRAADAFIIEGRSVLQTGEIPPPAFFRTHEELVTAVANLAAANLEASGAKARKETQRAQRRVRYSLVLLAVAVAVACASAVFTIHTVNKMFKQLRWQAAELAQLSSRSMSDQEANARRFSRELHDHFGQTLNAIEANLVAMQNKGNYDAVRMEDCLALIKDAIDNVREVSQLLRPSILDDFGLDASLRWLAESFAERTGIEVKYHSTFSGRLDDETETQLFRIAQEALTNVSRHANATRVDMRLHDSDARLRLTITDNGRGFLAERTPRGLGLLGMRARARTACATLDIVASPGKGSTIRVELATNAGPNASKDSHLVSG